MMVIHFTFSKTGVLFTYMKSKTIQAFQGIHMYETTCIFVCSVIIHILFDGVCFWTNAEINLTTAFDSTLPYDSLAGDLVGNNYHLQLPFFVLHSTLFNQTAMVYVEVTGFSLTLITFCQTIGHFCLLSLELRPPSLPPFCPILWGTSFPPLLNSPPPPPPPSPVLHHLWRSNCICGSVALH